MSYEEGGRARRQSTPDLKWEDQGDISNKDDDEWVENEIEEMEEMEEMDDEDEPERYEVESVMSRKIEEGKEKFLVKWKGYTKPTWEPRENLDSCEQSLEVFYKVAEDTDLVTEPISTPIGPPTDDDFKQKLRDAYEFSLHLDMELYDRLILKRGVKDSGDIGPKIETVPIVITPSGRQNSISRN
ncbi:5873_t:CDS:2 [Acaulospora morrowiae]|uniref:5873_t:CDS:1 n=1 Tax=Acaulospora morrowiae TaxID=94023 RepID=A0A9N9G164_9GLOM|nr:5873_t:CDS:2 [Acaulospora morrowiae]